MRSKARYLSSISAVALLGLGVGSIAVVYWGLRESLASASAGHDLLFACRIASNTCKTAGISPAAIFGNPARTILLLAIAAFVASAVKGTLALAYSRRIRAEFPTSPILPAKLARICERIFEGKKPRFRISDAEKPMAFTNGIVKPSICLTTGLIAQLTEEELEAVIAHEYAHIRRRDNLLGFLASMIRDFLFPLPIAHFLFGLFAREKELAADELAVELTNKPYELASAMLTISRLNLDPMPGAALIAPAVATTETRIKKLLESDGMKEYLFAKLVIAFALSAMIVTAGVGAALANPAGEAAKKNCHIGVDCAFTQSHGDARLRNSCISKR